MAAEILGRSADSLKSSASHRRRKALAGTPVVNGVALHREKPTVGAYTSRRVAGAALVFAALGWFLVMIGKKEGDLYLLLASSVSAAMKPKSAHSRPATILRKTSVARSRRPL